MNKTWCAMLLMLGVLSAVAFAAESETHNEAQSATINGYVDTTIDFATITFPASDPGTADVAASEGVITLTNTANSNTAIDIYLQSTVLTSGGFTIGVANIQVSKTLVGAKTSLVASGANPEWLSCVANPCVGDEGYYENIAKSGTAAFYFWLQVPAGQDAGAYTGTLPVKSVKSGNLP